MNAASKTNVTIRHLTANDHELLKSLLVVFGDAFDEVQTYSGAIPAKNYLRDVLSSNQFIALVALHNGIVVGGLAAYVLQKFEQTRNEIYIYDLAINQIHRRQGVAGALIKHIKILGKEMNAHAIYVQADHDDEPAIAFYSKLGARKNVLHFDL